MNTEYTMYVSEFIQHVQQDSFSLLEGSWL